MGLQRMVSRLLKQRSGQMTVELAVVFPVAILLALIALNAQCYLSEAASFDRLARQCIRVYGASPDCGLSDAAIAGQMEAYLQQCFSKENLSCHVEVAKSTATLRNFKATLVYRPELFGLSMSREVFGVALPEVSHTTELTLDTYRPGAWFRQLV